MVLTITQILCYVALLAAAAAVCVPYKPFLNRGVAAFAAAGAFLVLGLVTPLKEPPKDLSYFEWRVAKQHCRAENLEIGPCRVRDRQIASTYSEIDPSFK